MHQPICDISEKSGAGDLILEMDEIMKIRDSIVNIYAQRTGQPSWVIMEDMERDAILSPEDAQVHGIIDDIGIE